MTRTMEKAQPAIAPADERNAAPELNGAMNIDELRLQWRNLFGRAAPDHLTKALLTRIVAYRRQADAFGDLSGASASALARLVQSRASDREDEGATAQRPSSGPKVPPARSRNLAPGTILVREWKGEIQRVTVMQEGFAWNGRVFGSLSRVAREITGINWNGRIFFGIAGRRTDRRSSTTNGSDT